MPLHSFAIYESAAINTYLGDKFRGTGTKELVPLAGSQERGRYEQLCAATMAELDGAITIHDRHSAPKADRPAIPEAVASAEKRFASGAEILAAELAEAGGEFLLP